MWVWSGSVYLGELMVEGRQEVGDVLLTEVLQVLQVLAVGYPQLGTEGQGQAAVGGPDTWVCRNSLISRLSSGNVWNTSL